MARLAGFSSPEITGGGCAEKVIGANGVNTAK